MKTIEVKIYNLYKSIKINIEENDTINNVKRKICKEIDGAFNKIRLYPLENDKIKTGYSFYGLNGDISFNNNYSEYNNFIVLLIL